MKQACLDHSLVKYKISGEVVSATPSARKEVELDSFWARGSFKINEFLEYQGAEFLNNAYRAIFKRFPDHNGFRHYQSILDAGISREKIIGVLRYSDEGEKVGVHIDGLKPRICYRSVYGPRMLLKKLVQKIKSGQRKAEPHNGG